MEWSDYSTPALWAQFVPRGTEGQNGSFRQYVYKNATSNPGHPANNPDGQSSPSTYPPSGWTIDPVQPDFANGYYTWCSYRTVSYDIDNNIQYGPWETAYRTTGDNGKNGEDGNSTEFIYRRFDYEPTWTNNNLNPAYWNTNQNPDYTGEAFYDEGSDAPNNKWGDNPRGISNDFKFEYVASREFKLYGPQGAQTKEWGKFTTPSLWSRYGEKGMDGDGYEYIYARTSTSVGDPNSISQGTIPDPLHPNQRIPSTDKQQDDWVPNTWYDDPQGVSSTPGQEKEFVATRKKTFDSLTQSMKWGPYSTPALWAQYVPQGSQGAQGDPGAQGGKGDTGDPGQDALVYHLYDWGSKAGYGLTLTSNNSIDTSLAINLKFRVNKVERGITTPVSYSQLHTLGMSIYVLIADGDSPSTAKQWYRFTSYSGYDIKYDYNTYYFTYYWNEQGKQNFCNNNQFLRIALIPSTNSYLSENDPVVSEMKDDEVIQLELTNNAQWNMISSGSNPSIRSLVTGIRTVEGHVDGVQGIVNTHTNNISDIYQQMDRITSTVTQIGGDVTDLETDVYNIGQDINDLNGDINGVQGQVRGVQTQSQNGIQGVQGQVNGVQGQVNGVQSETSQKIAGVQSQIDQTAREIDLHVVELGEDLTTKLSNTGINISQKKIQLRGNQVTFCDSYGGHQGNIWIDPTYGTLHAVNGDFSGKITATEGSITGNVNLGPSNGYHIELNPDDRSLKGYSNSSNQTFELSTWYNNTFPILRMKDPQTGTWSNFAPKSWNISASHGSYNTVVRSETEYGGDGYALLQLYYIVNGYSVTASAEIKAKWNDLEIVLVGLPRSQPTKTGRLWVDNDGYVRMKV